MSRRRHPGEADGAGHQWGAAHEDERVGAGLHAADPGRSGR